MRALATSDFVPALETPRQQGLCSHFDLIPALGTPKTVGRLMWPHLIALGTGYPRAGRWVLGVFMMAKTTKPPSSGAYIHTAVPMGSVAGSCFLLHVLGTYNPKTHVSCTASQNLNFK